MTTTMHAATDVPAPYHLRERGDHKVENQFNLGSNYPGFFPDLVNAFPVTNPDEAHT